MSRAPLNKIMNPRTGRWVKTSRELGKTILNNYLSNMYGGAKLTGENITYINDILSLLPSTGEESEEIYVKILLRGKNAISDKDKKNNITKWGNTQLKQVYTGLSLMLHPDKNPSNKTRSEKAFQLLASANSWAKSLLEKGNMISADISNITSSGNSPQSTGRQDYAESTPNSSYDYKETPKHTRVTVDKELEDFFEIYKQSLIHRRWGFFREHRADLLADLTHSYKPESSSATHTSKSRKAYKSPYGPSSSFWGDLGSYWAEKEAEEEKERKRRLKIDESDILYSTTQDDQLHEEFTEKLHVLKMLYFSDVDYHIDRLRQERYNEDIKRWDYKYSKHYKKDINYQTISHNTEILTIGLDIALSVKREKDEGRDPSQRWVKYISPYASPYQVTTDQPMGSDASFFGSRLDPNESFWVNTVTGETVSGSCYPNCTPYRQPDIDGKVVLANMSDSSDKIDDIDTNWLKITDWGDFRAFWLNTDIGQVRYDDPYEDEHVRAARLEAKQAREDRHWERYRREIREQEEARSRLQKFRQTRKKLKKTTRGIIASNRWSKFTDNAIESRIMQKVLDNCEWARKENTVNWEICPKRYISSLNKKDLLHFLNDVILKGTESKSELVELAVKKSVRFLKTIQVDTYQIHVETLTGQTTVLDVKVTDTIKILKQKIREKIGVPLKQQTLYFSGNKLEDNKTLDEYYLNESSAQATIDNPVRLVIKL